MALILRKAKIDIPDLTRYNAAVHRGERQQTITHLKTCENLKEDRHDVGISYVGPERFHGALRLDWREDR